MGSSLNKDPTLSIYIALNKRVYFAGETLEGTVHIDCKANRPYNQLRIKLHGCERVHWQQNHNKVQIHYTNFRQTYNEEFPLAQFNMGIQTGQYTFPFSILLPSTLPGTLEFGWDDNYIRFIISAYLPAYDSNSEAQACQRKLHIREPCRSIQKSFSIRDVAQAVCCSCCCICGCAELQLQADAVGLFQNQTFHVRGNVNNRLGSTNIKKFKIVLRECTKQVSEWSYTHVSNEQFVLIEYPNQVPVGTSTPFNTEIKIPIQVLNHTSIGNIIYKAFYLDLVAEVNCCYSNPKISKHVIINNTLQPEMEEGEIKKAPERWNPIVAPPISFVNSRPYIWSPVKEIDVKNQIGEIAPLQFMPSSVTQIPPY